MRWGHDCSWQCGRNQHIQCKKTLTFKIYLTLFYLSFILQRPFCRILFFVFAIFRCSVLFWFQKIMYVYCIYSPNVSLVLCELLNVMVVCLPIILFFVPFGFWLIVCSSFSMKCLHIDPCLCLFPQLLHNVTVFHWHVSLKLYLV